MTGFEYFEPDTIEDAVKLLATREEARCLAGGQTLVAMMNAGLLEPKVLVSLRRVSGLNEIKKDEDGSLWIGAMVRHAELASESRLKGALQVLREAASVIAHPAIRNLGTLGGSLCHADPNGDYPAAVVAAGGDIEIAGPNGRRIVSAVDFFSGYFATVLEEGELLSRVRLPQGSPSAVGTYTKFSRVDGDYATVSVAVVLDLKDNRCTFARISLGACGMTPIWVREADEHLVGTDLNDAAINSACAALREASDPVDDVRGSADYRRLLIPRLVRRAVHRAIAMLEVAR